MSEAEHDPLMPAPRPRTARWCGSVHHEPPVPAVVVGVYDPSRVQDGPVEHDRACCASCAQILTEFGMFAEERKV